ncbi:hypothetical protein QQZ08_002981 [Neonectria magnoliae]|uniref:Methyltransferase n=1 Tax=Neonectria magnoliae TaxID=2732573 RepID=A0ABR1IC07_9HYPO
MSETRLQAGEGDAQGESQTHAFQSAGHWAELAQQGDGDDGIDAESVLGTQAPTSTASLSSSILQYRTIHGRTYHSEQGNAEYWASNDEEQNECQDLNHHAMLLILDNKLFLAPLKSDVQKVLDVGTGTGIWAIEIEDCNQTWTFGPNSFDYVHMRYLFGSIKNWNDLFNNAYRVCKPGG